MAVVAENSITLVRFLDAYGSAEEGGYEGSPEEFYDDLGGLKGLPAKVQKILEDDTISPPERAELRMTLYNIEREVAELTAKLAGDTGIVQALSAAADPLINALRDIVGEDGYSEIDFDYLMGLFEAYAVAVASAQSAVAELTETRFGELTTEQFSLGKRIGDYEEQLILESDLITMKVDVDGAYQPVMTLGQDELAFYSQGQKISYFAGQRMMIENAVVIQQLEIGNHIMEKYGTKYTIFRWTGD